MTNGLSPSARALLDAARAGMSPSPGAIARMRANVIATASVGTVSGAIGIKLVVLGVVGVAAIGALLARDSDAPTKPVAIDLSAPGLSPPATTVAAVDIAVAPLESTPSPAAVPPIARPRRIERTISLPREVELIDRAMTALRRDDASSALVAIGIYMVETRGAGQLAEDAAAYEIQALCRLGDPRVDQKLAAFDRRFPLSANRSRLDALCP
jgi:hypothetical protein